MNPNPHSCLDEMEKIALASPGMGMMGRAAGGLRKMIGKGWNSQGGKLWQGIGLGMTALQLPGALRKIDPSGQGHSRTERLTGLAGDTLGGFAGAGAATHYFPQKGISNIVAPMVVGGLGGYAGRKLLSTPFSLARRLRQPNRDVTAPGESWRNQAPVFSPLATEGRELL